MMTYILGNKFLNFRKYLLFSMEIETFFGNLISLVKIKFKISVFNE